MTARLSSTRGWTGAMGAVVRVAAVALGTAEAGTREVLAHPEVTANPGNESVNRKVRGIISEPRIVQPVITAAGEQSVAPDRAAILVSRDTTPLQAARQVNAVVRALEDRCDRFLAEKVVAWVGLYLGYRARTSRCS